ncbi:MAG: hypothetical protein CVT92_02670 [Bacteroidetes bacterium HGW-Bacteroidetes-1]|jgi:hypothetical protein|nr:MAG: hypothetical protein CVT92_02670 [Bacteroidetes bacterium HGW-Bacteroidetes-1]
MNYPDCQKIHGGSCKLVHCENYIVRNNLMNVAFYTPYCGSETCHKGTIRTKFDKTKKQFVCECGWVSAFSEEFIEYYMKKWGIK